MLASYRPRIVAIIVAIMCCAGIASANPPALQVPDQDTCDEIALEAYVYAYPLVLMEATHQAMTASRPMNQWDHMRTFPDATFTDVVRPNADHLVFASLV